jgi:toxin ParE1/3/4
VAKYFLSNKAVEDLSKIWDYTYEVWSESQADKYYEFLIETCKGISKNPTIGKYYTEIANEILGFRAGKHIIFYREAKPKEIEILRILHERMDLKNKIDE